MCIYKTNVYIYIYIYIHTYVYIYIYICSHTGLSRMLASFATTAAATLPSAPHVYLYKRQVLFVFLFVFTVMLLLKLV